MPPLSYALARSPAQILAEVESQWSLVAPKVHNVRQLAESRLLPGEPRRSLGLALQHSGIVYVGRRQSMLGLAGHDLANPHKLAAAGRGTGHVEKGADGDQAERLACLAKYWLTIRERWDLAAQVELLRGRQLACWCSPRLCHAHLLALLANGYRA